MGAHNFEDYGYGKTAEEAHRELCDQARFEYGHNPYNGTISTTSGCVHIPPKEGENHLAWTQRVLDDPRVQKWENCAYRVDEEFPEENGRKRFIFHGWAAC